MSRTYGHRKSCRKSNCDMCEKGVWRRLNNTRRRREDRREVEKEEPPVLEWDYPSFSGRRYCTNDYDPETNCVHGNSGREGDWCENDCHSCPVCGIFGNHAPTCELNPSWPSAYTL